MESKWNSIPTDSKFILLDSKGHSNPFQPIPAHSMGHSNTFQHISWAIPDSDIWSDFTCAHQTVVPTFVVNYFLIRRYSTATACSPDFSLSITNALLNTQCTPTKRNTTNTIPTVRAALTLFATQLIERKLVREAK